MRLKTKDIRMIATKLPVFISGASGYIATHIVEQLIKKGYRVRGSVRSLKNEQKLHPIKQFTPEDDPSRLELVEADLMKDGSFDQGVQGCEVVIHVASPFVLDVKNFQKDLVEPAISGTQNILKACAKAQSVKTVIVTSSMAAVTDNPHKDHVFTENDWNKDSSLTRNPYYYSKKLAEEAAWKFIETPSNFSNGKCHFKLIVINPGAVLGPSHIPAKNGSAAVVTDTINGKYPGIMGLSFAMVDVRDVAKAHIAAFENPDAAGRYLCVADTKSHGEITDLIQKNYPEYNLPKFPIPNLLVKGLSYFQPIGIGSYLRTHVSNYSFVVDNSKIIRDLNMDFIPTEQTIYETVKDMKKWKHIT